uniref:Uncharacterized protein n=1 Tax=Amphimedon queenslandica TaxID=400682 RepID=A0A1X7T906_AMPQE
FSLHGTRDLLMCFLFVVEDLNINVLIQWWQDCVDAPVPYKDPLSPIGSPVGGAGGGAYNRSNEISAFSDVLESCAHIFEYIGRIEM